MLREIVGNLNRDLIWLVSSYKHLVFLSPKQYMKCLWPHFPPCSSLSPLLPAPTASGTHSAPTPARQAVCLSSLGLEQPSSRNWPGFFMLCWSLHSIQKGFHSLLYTSLFSLGYWSPPDKFICYCLSSPKGGTQEGDLSSLSAGAGPVSAQPLTGGGPKERNEGCKQNTSGHNLDWGPWEGWVQAVKVKLRSSEWWGVRHMGAGAFQGRNKR